MSERNITEDIKDELEGDILAPIFLLRASFPDGEVFVWTGYGTLNWDSQNWEGLGEFISLDLATETLDGSSQGSSVTVGGIDSDMFTGVTMGEYQGGSAKIYLGMLNQETGAVLDSPYLLFSGTLDSDECEDSGDTVSLKINIEHRMSDLLRAREYRYTDQDQQTLHPNQNDKGLEFVGSMVDVDLKWGEASDDST